MSPAYQPSGSGFATGRVIVTESLFLVDTFPAASLAHAYSVFVPTLGNV
jgi:hypothetical protein